MARTRVKTTKAAEKPVERENVKAHPSLRCQFCNKSTLEVEYMIAGPTVFICSDCVDICNDIIREARKEEAAKAKAGDAEAST